MKKGKQSKADVLNQDARFRRLLEDVETISVQGYMPDGTILYWNKASEKLYGYSSGYAIGRNIIDLIMPPELKDYARLAIEEMARTGKPISPAEYLLMRKDGTRVPVFSSHTVIQIPGLGQELFCIDIDLTGQKAANMALNESEEKFRSISEQTNDLIIITDVDGIITYASPSSKKLFQLEPDEMCGHYFEDFLYKTSFSGEVKTFHNSVMHGKETKDLQIKFKRKDGSFFVGEINGSRHLYGEKNGILLIIRDITERKQTEEEVHKIGQHYKALIEKAPDGIVLLDENGRFKSVTSTAKKIFGYSDTELVKINPAELTHPEDQEMVLKELDKLFLDPSYIPTLRYRFAHKTKKWIWVESIFSNLLSDPNVKAIVINFRDISDRKKAEEEIMKLKEELEQRVISRTEQLEATNKELEAFSYSVSHDLRAPVRHINGFAQIIINDYYNQLPEEVKHYIDTISVSAKKMGTLIDDLLRFSRTGRSAMTKISFKMNQVVDDALLQITSSIINRNIDWKISELPEIKGDYNLLRMVWINLLENAVKYTSTREKAMIEIGYEKEAEDTIFYIRDNGVGFDMEYSKKLFGVFQRLHSSAQFEGTGIGLANVRMIIARHGGITRAKAEVDKGATFYFTLPD
jgi:PAS domain S-box-containing protein